MRKRGRGRKEVRFVAAQGGKERAKFVAEVGGGSSS